MYLCCGGIHDEGEMTIQIIYSQIFQDDGLIEVRKPICILNILGSLNAASSIYQMLLIRRKSNNMRYNKTSGKSIPISCLPEAFEGQRRY